MESALSEVCRRIEAAELHRVTLGVGRYTSLVVAAELVHMAGFEEGHHAAVVGIGLGAVVLRKAAVGKDNLAAVELYYEEEVHMAAVEVEGMDYVMGLHMVVDVVEGIPGCTVPGLDIHLAAAAGKEAADLVRL